jgi:membrane-bound lytic murein transglycosylase MltF
LAQFMPATAEDVAKDFPELGKASPTNAEWAIRAMVRYMKQIDERITAVDECNHHAFTLSGYNGGLGWVLRDKKATLNIPGLNSEVWWGNVEAINAGRNDDAFRENRGYPRRIIKKLQPHYASWGRMVCVS